MNSLENRIALRNCGCIDPDEISDYQTKGEGYTGLVRALSMGPQGAIDELRKSLLRGRGGAGYPTADKWQTVADAEGEEKYVICNAVDGDPRSRVAKTLIEGDPHSILEGALIAAYAVGASRCIVALPGNSQAAISKLEKATGQMKEKSLLGERILDSEFSCQMEIREIPKKLAAGEETALLRALAGGQAMSSIRPPFPSDKGYLGKPTLVENVETLSNVSAIFQRGSDWFLDTGTEESKGTKIITLSGAVSNPCTVEVPFGSLISQVVEEIGGTPRAEIKTVQVGGPTGAFLAAKDLDLPFTYETLAASGGIVGSGSIDVVPTHTCAVEMLESLILYVHQESCGKCVFCREGTLQMSDVLHDITRGEGKMQDLELLASLGEEMKIGSTCGLGRSAPNPVLSGIRLFREEFETHIREKKCPEGDQSPAPVSKS
jgi:NADH:ubiquinone oxidoreductase subunit F (NADH-binding)